MPDKELKILIVDDSVLYRNTIEKVLQSIEGVKVVGSVWNGKKAIDYILQSGAPDIITLDIEMPEVDGIETLNIIRQMYKEKPELRRMKVIVVSSLAKDGSEATINALQSGAFDYILKPQSEDINLNLKNLKKQLEERIQLIQLLRYRDIVVKPSEPVIIHKVQNKTVDAIGIGVSTGGPKVLADLLPGLCEFLTIPVFIVQHMPAEFTQTLARNLNKKCKHAVIEAIDNDLVKNNTIYIAPGGKHLILRRDNYGNVVTGIIDNPPENGSKPSVDVLFRSMANIYEGNMISMILTGMGSDGSKSLKRLKRAGAYIIAQDEASSIIWGMPGSAVNTGLVDAILPLDKIIETTFKIVNHKR